MISLQKKSGFGTPAFTLQELLVAIAVVSLLATLGLSQLGRILDKSAEVKCLANLRQIGVGVGLYAAESDGEWPYFVELNMKPEDRRGSWSSHIIWNNSFKQFNGIGQIYPHLKSKEVFFCPKQMESKKAFREIPDWENPGRSIYGSYVVRGNGSTFNSDIPGTESARLGKKMFDISNRAIVSCDFLQHPSNPVYYPLTLHKERWPVLFGDGSVRVAETMPENVSPDANVWDITGNQIRFWDYFDTFH